jgi:hypothetical protein
MATSSGSWQSWPDGAGVAWVCVGADPDAPDADGEPAALAGLLGAAESGASLAESAGWGGRFEPSLAQAATTTVAPSASALPPIPLASTK